MQDASEVQEMGWFRHDNRMRHDAKVRALNDQAYRLWNALLEIASELQLQGLVHFLPGVPFTDEQLADEAKIPVDAVKPGLATMVRFRMVEERTDGLFVINFAKRQYQSDVSTGRVKAFRERQKQQDGNGDETFQQRQGNGDETPPDTDTDTDTDIKNTLRDVPSGKKQKQAVEGIPFELACLLRTAILTNHQKAKVPEPTPSAMNKWSDIIEKTIRLDERSPEEVREMIGWVQRHHFWNTVILSAANLREKWDKMDAQRMRPTYGSGSYRDHTQTQPTGESMFDK